MCIGKLNGSAAAAAIDILCVHCHDAGWVAMDAGDNCHTVDLGGVTITALTDALGSFTRFTDAFPRASPPLEERGRIRYPELFVGADWVLPFRAFLVRSRQSNILIDAGIGPAPNPFLRAAQGWLPQKIGAAGVSRDEVEVVVLTHLHVDHVGWCASEGRPFFPRARYVASAKDWRFFSTRAASRDVFDATLAPLEQAGVLTLVTADQTTIEPSVTLHPTPGHTPGHLSVFVRGHAAQAVILGDVAVHPLQLTDPDLRYAHEEDGDLAAQTRRALVETLADTDTVVAAGHLPGGLGHIGHDRSGFSWTPVPRT
jgi:glyoxylase-like metal-dependent hydrolase (beta-lactamase superfamily II)